MVCMIIPHLFAYTMTFIRFLCGGIQHVPTTHVRKGIFLLDSNLPAEEGRRQEDRGAHTFAHT